MNPPVDARDETGLEIAIVGMAGRFPRARNLREFWRNLRDGIHCTTFFSDEELTDAGIGEDLLRDSNYIKAGPVLDGIEEFDAGFFGYTPREAETMDPQQRFFLECAWEALEDAGYDPSRCEESIGVYGGVGYNHYRVRNLSIDRDPFDTALGYQAVLGNEKDFLTTRVSYKLGLEGPSLVVQTACSTSLVAVHLACQALLGGECDLAMAGGVTLRVPQIAGYLCQEGGIASPDGHCRAFDADAAGCMPGAGVGIVVLKRLSDALADGDCIRAVIKASSINNDGAMKIGYTAPRAEGQAKAIQTAQLLAQTPAQSITCIEAHGTGTALGDPIEVAALTQVFRAQTEAVGYCAIGSVKTNIGHADAAAGVAGLIKTVLSLEHRQFPPSLDFETPNPQLHLESSPFYVNTALREWQPGEFPRRAGVSSFGLGGANAHVIVEEAPAAPSTKSARPWQLLVLSAKSEAALANVGGNLATRLGEQGDINIADVASTLQRGRRQWPHRRAVVVHDAHDAEQALRGNDAMRTCSGATHDDEPSIAFMFPGQGAQYVDMGRELYGHEPAFRRHVDHCADLLEAELGFDLRRLLYPDTGSAQLASEELRQTHKTQPALFVLEYALARLWTAWGIRPGAMIGHSIGEYVAACLARVIDLEDALVLVAARARMMQALPGGAMLAVPLPEAEIGPLLASGLAVAAVNAPSLCVVSGPEDAVAAFQRELATRSIVAQQLRTSHAFHSAMMDAIVPGFRSRVAQFNLSAPRIPFVSNVTGTWITPEQATDPDYWARHLRQCVRFSEGVQLLAQQPGRVLLEVGPGQSLSSLAKMHHRQDPAPLVLASTRQAREDVSDCAFILKTLGRLWIAGACPDWAGLHDAERCHRVPLPTYPFERARYWVEPGEARTAHATAQPHTLRKRPQMADWFYVPSWIRAAPLEHARGERQSNTRCRWLLLTDASDLGDRLATRLSEQGDSVVIATRGSTFAKLDSDRYELHPGRRDDLQTLIAALDAAGTAPDRIVYLWGLTPPSPAATRAGQRIADMVPDFFGLVALAQALGNRDVWNPLRLFVITNQVYDVVGDEDLHPEKATITGPCHVIPQEYPNITCHQVDVRLSGTGKPSQERVVHQLILELTNDPAPGPVAWRGRHRWVQRFEPFPMAGGAHRPARLRDAGVYLITGGLGGIGLTLAEYLARSVRAKLVLVSRTKFPLRSEWEARLTRADASHEGSPPVCEQIRKLQELETLGSEVQIVCADVADSRQIRGAVKQARKRFGAIHGVVHCAGLTMDGIIQLKEAETAERVLAAKLAGTLNLHRIFKREPLDFLVLFSSLRSILGGKGLVDYCAANAFLDAFAHRMAATGGPPTISVNWGAWQSVGMSLQVPMRGDHQPSEALTLEDGMTPAEGVEAFSRILESAAPQVVVSPQDLPGLVSHYATVSASTAAEQKPPQDTGTDTAHSRPQLASPLVAPRNAVEASIADIWQELLGIERLSIHDNFFELGGDSLISLQFVARASRAGLRFSSKQVFEHQTIAELAAVAGSNSLETIEQSPLTGPVPLLPMQHWFFERPISEPHHWNLSILVEVRETMDPARLRCAVEQIYRHHDALRLRFDEGGDEWRQECAPPDDADVFSHIDLSTTPQSDHRRALEVAASKIQTGLSLSRGPVFRVALFDTGDGGTQHLLLVLHHLVADVSSWRILLEDLDTAYRQPGRSETVQLPAKTGSVKSWSEHLTQLAQSPKLRNELDYWLASKGTDVRSIPVDFPGGENTIGSARTVCVALGSEETRILQSELPRHNTQMADALLAAVHQAFYHWTGCPSLLVDMEEDGRQVATNGLDVSRTVGWFTLLYPLLLDLENADHPWEQLTAVRNAARGVPTQGLGYGLLRYLSRDAGIRAGLRTLPQPQVIFLYLGQFEGALPSSSLFAFTREAGGAARSPRAERRHLLEITASVDPEPGRLRLDWTYGENLHRRTTVESLAQRAVAWLASLSAHLQSAGPKAYTTGDFPGANLSQEQLDALVARIGASGGHS